MSCCLRIYIHPLCTPMATPRPASQMGRQGLPLSRLEDYLRQQLPQLFRTNGSPALELHQFSHGQAGGVCWRCSCPTRSLACVLASRPTVQHGVLPHASQSLRALTRPIPSHHAQSNPTFLVTLSGTGGGRLV